MKTYIVKDKIINIQTEEVQTYYFGKDGYCRSYPAGAEAYTRKIFAEKLIKKELEYYHKLGENIALESEKWLHFYSIIEMEN